MQRHLLHSTQIWGSTRVSVSCSRTLNRRDKDRLEINANGQDQSPKWSNSIEKWTLSLNRGSKTIWSGNLEADFSAENLTHKSKVNSKRWPKNNEGLTVRSKCEIWAINLGKDGTRKLLLSVEYVHWPGSWLNLCSGFYPASFRSEKHWANKVESKGGTLGWECSLASDSRSKTIGNCKTCWIAIWWKNQFWIRRSNSGVPMMEIVKVNLS